MPPLFPLPFSMDTLNTSNVPATPSPDFHPGVCVTRISRSKFSAKAFSLIELLVVIALLGILSAMLVIGISKLKTNGKRQQTHLILLNLQAMFSEADSVRHLSYGIGRLDYSKIADQPSMLKAIAMDCPGSLADGSDDRYGIPTPNTLNPTGSNGNPNPAVRFTRDFMATLMQFPATNAAIGKLPAGSLMTFPAVNYNELGATFEGVPNPWAAGTKFSIGGSYLRVNNPDQTADANNNYYIRTQIYADITGLPDPVTGITNPYGTIKNDDLGPSGDGAIGPPNPAYWLPELPGVPAQGQTLPISTPVVLDAWGNPIIFVFGGVLGNGTALVNNAVAPNSGAMIVGGLSFQQASPDHRPFFASAGPDGDMSKGDDNMYSFEK